MSSGRLVFALLGYLIQRAAFQVVKLEASTNPVYSDTILKITCMSTGYTKLRIADTSQSYSFIDCQASTSLTSREGIFLENNVISCNCSQTSLSIFLRAAPTWNLTFLCTATRPNSKSQSDELNLTIKVAPSPPDIQPAELLFNDGDVAVINCSSDNGSPAAEVNIALKSSQYNVMSISAFSINISILRLNMSKELHNATVTCSVLNHNLPNMTVSRTIKVNHISVKDTVRIELRQSDSLDCAQYMDSYPPPLFVWSPSWLANGSNVSGIIGPGLLSGDINCTAVNSVTGRNVTVRFIVTSFTTKVRLVDLNTVTTSYASDNLSTEADISPRLANESITHVSFTQKGSTITYILVTEDFIRSETIIISSAVSSVVVIVAAVTITVLCRRGFRKDRANAGCRKVPTDPPKKACRDPHESTKTGDLGSEINQIEQQDFPKIIDGEIEMKVNSLYGSSNMTGFGGANNSTGFVEPLENPQLERSTGNSGLEFSTTGSSYHQNPASSDVCSLTETQTSCEPGC